MWQSISGRTAQRSTAECWHGGWQAAASRCLWAHRFKKRSPGFWGCFYKCISRLSSPSVTNAGFPLFGEADPFLCLQKLGAGLRLSAEGCAGRGRGEGGRTAAWALSQNQFPAFVFHITRAATAAEFPRAWGAERQRGLGPCQTLRHWREPGPSGGTAYANRLSLCVSVPPAPFPAGRRPGQGRGHAWPGGSCRGGLRPQGPPS